MFEHVASWIAPEGNKTLEDVNGTSKQYDGFFVVISRAKAKPKGRKRKNHETDEEPRLKDHDFLRFLRERKFQALDDVSNNAIQKKLPTGNWKLADLLPTRQTVAELFKSSVGRDEASEAQIREQQVKESQSAVMSFVLEHRGDLLSEWPSKLDERVYNSTCEMLPKLVSQKSKVAFEMKAKEPAHVNSYLQRFRKPTWLSLFNLVRQHYPIWWDVVSPKKVATLAGDWGEEEKEEEQAVETIDALVSMIDSSSFVKAFVSGGKGWESLKANQFAYKLARELPALIRDFEGEEYVESMRNGLVGPARPNTSSTALLSIDAATSNKNSSNVQPRPSTSLTSPAAIDPGENPGLQSNSKRRVSRVAGVSKKSKKSKESKKGEQRPGSNDRFLSTTLNDERRERTAEAAGMSGS